MAREKQTEAPDPQELRRQRRVQSASESRRRRKAGLTKPVNRVGAGERQKLRGAEAAAILKRLNSADNLESEIEAIKAERGGVMPHVEISVQVRADIRVRLKQLAEATGELETTVVNDALEGHLDRLGDDS